MYYNRQAESNSKTSYTNVEIKNRTNLPFTGNKETKGVCQWNIQFECNKRNVFGLCASHATSLCCFFLTDMEAKKGKGAVSIAPSKMAKKVSFVLTQNRVKVKWGNDTTKWVSTYVI